MCDICVCRFDHHCIWVNNCIGIGNHRLFLGFLLSNCMLTAYGATLGGLILAHIVISTNLHKATFIHQITKEKYEPTFMTILHFLVGNENILVFVTVLCAVMSIVLLVFFFWHLNLLRIGQTSNELSKWRTLKEYLKFEAPSRCGRKEVYRRSAQHLSQGLLGKFKRSNLGS